MQSPLAAPATHTLVRWGLTTLEDQHTRARVAALLDTPEMRRSLQELSAGLAEGAVMGLSSADMVAHIDRLVAHFTQALVAAVDQTFDAMLTPEHEARIARMTSLVVRDSIRAAADEIPASLAPAMHRAIADDLGPAIRETMQKDVPAGLADMMRSPDVQKALGQATHEIALQAVLGADDGAAESQSERKRTYQSSKRRSPRSWTSTSTRRKRSSRSSSRKARQYAPLCEIMGRSPIAPEAFKCSAPDAGNMEVFARKAAKKEIAMIKVVAPLMAGEVIDRAIQAHGAGGVSGDFPLAKAWASSRTLRLADGPDEVHLETIAKTELSEQRRTEVQ